MGRLLDDQQRMMQGAVVQGQTTPGTDDSEETIITTPTPTVPEPVLHPNAPFQATSEIRANAERDAAANLRHQEALAYQETLKTRNQFEVTRQQALEQYFGAEYAANQTQRNFGWTGGSLTDQKIRTQYLQSALNATLYSQEELMKAGYESELAIARSYAELKEVELANLYYDEAVKRAIAMGDKLGYIFYPEIQEMLNNFQLAKQILGTSSSSAIEIERANTVMNTAETFMISIFGEADYKPEWLDSLNSFSNELKKVYSTVEAQQWRYATEQAETSATEILVTDAQITLNDLGTRMPTEVMGDTLLDNNITIAGTPYPITWTSSNDAIFNPNGTITRHETEDKTVRLTATITVNGAPVTKTFDVIVKANITPPQVRPINDSVSTAGTPYTVSHEDRHTLLETLISEVTHPNQPNDESSREKVSTMIRAINYGSVPAGTYINFDFSPGEIAENARYYYYDGETLTFVNKRDVDVDTSVPIFSFTDNSERNIARDTFQGIRFLLNNPEAQGISANQIRPSDFGSYLGSSNPNSKQSFYISTIIHAAKEGKLPEYFTFNDNYGASIHGRSKANLWTYIDGQFYRIDQQIGLQTLGIFEPKSEQDLINLRTRLWSSPTASSTAEGGGSHDSSLTDPNS